MGTKFETNEASFCPKIISISKKNKKMLKNGGVSMFRHLVMRTSHWSDTCRNIGTICRTFGTSDKRDSHYFDIPFVRHLVNSTISLFCRSNELSVFREFRSLDSSLFRHIISPTQMCRSNEMSDIREFRFLDSSFIRHPICPT